MTAVGAVGLVAGRSKSFATALFITFTSMLISDMFFGFHPLMWATYGGMTFAVIVGKLLGKRNGIGIVAFASLVSSIVFFLITNLAVWTLPYSMYPHTRAGLMDCYIAAIPFFRNSIIGDVMYMYVLVYAPYFVRATKRLRPVSTNT